MDPIDPSSDLRHPCGICRVGQMRDERAGLGEDVAAVCG
eukprot:CAMPEP_0181180414 /NCGR_PEP_ID=MMETSP1096-20121128/6783_1 /TAXON_ID=156174 ORGANISM="Chrysochromulina ericina, Strain CCMP281" /NCGR_SAMPLE_ID=MMETSP1096 /ASSEMBLY_ACC=CAM_ASM_000453 /LENGTH=38 /DNA_ID= /DNA_START= /DNA_END= /DNA_ORIENTATION=